MRESTGVGKSISLGERSYEISYRVSVGISENLHLLPNFAAQGYWRNGLENPLARLPGSGVGRMFDFSQVSSNRS